MLLLDSGNETCGSEYFRLGWDVVLLALNRPLLAFSPPEDFVILHGRWIGAGLILLLGLKTYCFFGANRGLPLPFLFYLIDLALVCYLFFCLASRKQFHPHVGLGFCAGYCDIGWGDPAPDGWVRHFADWMAALEVA